MLRLERIGEQVAARKGITERSDSPIQGDTQTRLCTDVIAAISSCSPVFLRQVLKRRLSSMWIVSGCCAHRDDRSGTRIRSQRCRLNDELQRVIGVRS